MRTKKYTPIELKKQIDKYFIEIDKDRSKRNDYGYVIDHVPKDIPTVSGLALHLGLSRAGMKLYRDDPETGDIMESALLKVSMLIEKGMLSGTYRPATSIFYMKAAFGWRENNQVQESHTPVSL